MLQFFEKTWPSLLMGIGIAVVFHLVKTRVPKGDRILRAFALAFPIVVAIVLLVVGPPVSRWIVLGTIATVALIAVVHRIANVGSARHASRTVLHGD